MNADLVAAIISACGFLLSVGTCLFISGARWGSVKTRLDVLENSVANSATKDQLSGVKEDVAEIKGMFRMTLRDGT
jgi:hypothetical protein